jgi:DNA-binding MurR/RpiR family transcriptional regulator
VAKTASEAIKAAWGTLTETEKKVGHAILSDYPLSGLGTISELAQKSHVSAATITRLIGRLGYPNFIAFREAMRGEVEAQFLSPIDKQRALSARTRPEEPGLLALLDEVGEHIRESAGRIQDGDFREVVDLLSDRSRRVFLVGGRMTRTVTAHMALTLHSLRPEVRLMDAGSLDAVEQIADMRPKDVLVALDVRRYQRGAIELARRASAKGCKIVLITDEWISPISAYANTIFALKVGTDSIWDSLAVPLLFGEALVNAVGLRIWPQAQARLRELEGYWSSWMTFDSGGVQPNPKERGE